MIKPYVRWCVCIALSLLPAQALAADPTTAAQDAAGAVMQQFGSADGIRQNASLPLTSDSAQLSTIDGSDSDAVQINNPSSNAFLSVSIQKAATGDLLPVRVSQDLDFDGVFDYAYQVPFPASGSAPTASFLVMRGHGTTAGATPGLPMPRQERACKVCL